MAVPVAAVAVGVGGFLKSREAERRERNIQDRVSKYQGFDDAKLQAIIRDYGGEMGEAAARVLNTRVQQVTVAPPTSAGLAESVTRNPSSVLMLGLVGVVVLLLIRR